MANRKNPKYPPWHHFAGRICPECGEIYEPFCELKHVCRKQNSYPQWKRKCEEANEKDD